MKQVHQILIALRRDESDQDLIEYALVAALTPLRGLLEQTTRRAEINNALSKIWQQAQQRNFLGRPGAAGFYAHARREKNAFCGGLSSLYRLVRRGQ